MYLHYIIILLFSKTQGPSESCASNTVYREISADAKKAILDLHNDLRRKVAKGEETNGVNPPQPGATNMRKLVKFTFCFLYLHTKTNKMRHLGQLIEF